MTPPATPAAAAAVPAVAARQLLADRRYRRLFAANVVSRAGTWMSTLGLTWAVLHASGSATVAGLVSGLFFVPALLLGPALAGRVDRTNRRRLLLRCELALTACWATQAALATRAHPPLWLIAVLALGTGCVTALEQPTVPALLADVVGEDRLPAAMRLNQLGGSTARLLGTAVGGTLVALVGAPVAIACDAASFAVFAAVLLSLGPVSSAAGRARESARMRDTVRLVLRTPPLAATLLIVAVVPTICRNYPITIPVLTAALHGGAHGYAAASASFAAGVVAGSLLAIRLRSTRLGLLLGATAVFGCVQAATAAVPNLPAACVLLLATGMLAAVGDSTASIRAATLAPPQMRGRVMALYSAAFLGGNPVGQLLTGLAGDSVGIRTFLLAAGAVAVATAAAVAVWTRRAGTAGRDGGPAAA